MQAIFFFLELDGAKRHIEQEKKQIDDLTRERDILNKVCEGKLYVNKSIMVNF